MHTITKSMNLSDAFAIANDADHSLPRLRCAQVVKVAACLYLNVMVEPVSLELYGIKHFVLDERDMIKRATSMLFSQRAAKLTGDELMLVTLICQERFDRYISR